MNIDATTIKNAMHIFENKYGSLYELLNDLSKSERRKLLRYGKLSKRVLTKNNKDMIRELYNVSFEFRQILNKLIAPRYVRRK